MPGEDHLFESAFVGYLLHSGSPYIEPVHKSCEADAYELGCS